jgi:uncharacterized protein (TIGR03067 family)
MRPPSRIAPRDPIRDPAAPQRIPLARPRSAGYHRPARPPVLEGEAPPGGPIDRSKHGAHPPMPRYAAALAVLLTASLAHAGDVDKLKGKWTAKVGPNQETEIVIEFQDKAFIVTVPDGSGDQLHLEGEYVLEEEAKPKKIDLIKFTSPDGQPIEDNLGIYEINEAGDEVKICTGGPGQDRPDTFGPPNGDRGTITLKKKKD